MSDESRFGKYELGAKLSSGGMAITYRATLNGAQGVKKPVVLKLIHPHLADNKTFAELFVSEAKLSAQLTHGNIAQVFDFGELDGRYFIAMELVEGHSLAAVLKVAGRRGIHALPESISMQIAIEMCEALNYAHTRLGADGKPLGVVHRDVSPENVMLSSSGEVKLLDFGIAKSTQKTLRTETGMVRGKYPYFSPEQARADDIDSRTDIWATGVVLYEMLCERRPYEGEFVDVMRSLVNGDFPLPTALNPGIGHELEAVILKALAYDRAARFETARDMGLALTDILHAEHPQAHRSDLQWMLQTMFGPDAAKTDLAAEMRRQFPARGDMATPARARASSGHGAIAKRRSRADHDTVAELEPVPTDLRQRNGPDRTSTQEDQPAVDLTTGKNPAIGSSESAEPPTDVAGVTKLRGLNQRPEASFETPEMKKKRDRFVKIAVGVLAALIIGVLFLAWRLSQPTPAPEPMTPVWVTSTPTGATVMLDGKEVGKTPFEGLVPYGPHTFGMALPGYRPWSRRTTLQVAFQVPIEGALVPVNTDQPVEVPHGPAQAQEKPMTETPDGPVAEEPEQSKYDIHWPLREFTISAKLHTIPILERTTARVELDPKTVYLVTLNGRLSYGHSRSTSTYALLLEGDNVADKDRLTWMSKPRRITGAVAMRLFVFDDEPADNEGHVTVTLFKTKYEPSRVVALKPDSMALPIGPTERVRVDGLDPTHKYLLTFHDFDAKVGKGAPRSVFCRREAPSVEPPQKAIMQLPFTFHGEVVGVSALECFFLDLNENKSAGEIQVDLVDRTLEDQKSGK